MEGDLLGLVDGATLGVLDGEVEGPTVGMAFGYYFYNTYRHLYNTRPIVLGLFTSISLPTTTTTTSNYDDNKPNSVSVAAMPYLSLGGMGRWSCDGCNAKVEHERPGSKAPLPAPLA